MGRRVVIAGVLFVFVVSFATTDASPQDKKPKPKPKSIYTFSRDSEVQDGVPRGSVTKMPTWKSEVYAGTERDWWIYVPSQYDAKTPANVMVFQDGQWYQDVKGDYRVPVVFDNLIHQKKMPVTIGIFLTPGRFPGKDTPQEKGKQRSIEYDTLSNRFATFLEKEILAEVGKKYTLTKDASGRGIGGISSGGICAFTVAWERPDLFTKVLSHVGSFTNIRGGDRYPGMIRKTPKKPIRVFLQAGKKDLDNEHGSWPLGNLQMEAALKYKGYEYKFVMGEEGHNGKHGGAILPESMIWLWGKE
jgi:enterochelin esterase family protein